MEAMDAALQGVFGSSLKYNNINQIQPKLVVNHLVYGRRKPGNGP